jgi:spore coat polysaccharide biosynthesis protein SpsF
MSAPADSAIRRAGPRIVCIIEARFRSVRLPGKVLMPILGEPMLGRVIERMRLARTVDAIVVATTDSSADDPVAAFVKASGAGIFRGSEDDVLNRVVSAARAHDADVIVEITGDCPLVDPGLVDKVVGDFCAAGADFVSNILPRTTPRGTDVRVFTADALAEIDQHSTDPADREHVSLHFWEHPERYRIRNVVTELPASAAGIRLTVDTEEDLELARAIYEELYPANPAFSLSDVLSLLDKRPELLELNRAVTQKAAR